MTYNKGLSLSRVCVRVCVCVCVSVKRNSRAWPRVKKMFYNGSTVAVGVRRRPKVGKRLESGPTV